MLYVTDNIQLIQRVPYQGSSWRVWKLQNRKKSNTHTVKYAVTLCCRLRKKRCYRAWLRDQMQLEGAVEWKWMWV